MDGGIMDILKVKFSVIQITGFIFIDLLMITVLIISIFFTEKTPQSLPTIIFIGIFSGLSICFFTPYIIFAIKYRIFVYDDKIKFKTLFSEKEYNFKDITFVSCHTIHSKGVTTKYYTIYFNKKHYYFDKKMKNSKLLLDLLTCEGHLEKDIKGNYTDRLDKRH